MSGRKKESKEGQERVFLYIDENLKKEIKKFCIDENTSMAKILNDIVCQNIHTYMKIDKK